VKRNPPGRSARAGQEEAARRTGARRLPSVSPVFTILTAFSFNFFSFALFRFFTGMGVGGEYSAIHSAVDELVPARLRGQTSLAISSTFWAGAALASVLSLIILNATFVPTFYGWRLTFFIGGALGLLILLTRRFIPESPRWLMTHGKTDEAEQIAEEIEDNVRRYKGGEELPEVEENQTITVEQRESIGFGIIARAMFQMYPKRTVLGLVLMASQAFLYNAIFFTYALVLNMFFGIPEGSAGWYLLGLAAGSLIGPITLGRLFGRVGRRPMITGCYAAAGILLAVAGYLFAVGAVGAVVQTVLFGIMFFFASSSASAAYLTASEIFPMELTAMALGLFYAIANAIGGHGPLYLRASDRHRRSLEPLYRLPRRGGIRACGGLGRAFSRRQRRATVSRGRGSTAHCDPGGNRRLHIVNEKERYSVFHRRCTGTR
jgi:MFS family permease